MFRLYRIFLSGFVFVLCACSAPKTKVPVNALSQRTSGEYIVQSGESLSHIAARFGWDVKKLAKANHISPPYLVKPGQKIQFVGPSKRRMRVVKQQLSKLDSADAAPVVALFVKQEDHFIMKHHSPAVTPVVKTNSSLKAHSKAKHYNGNIPWEWPAKGKILHRFNNTTKNQGIDIGGAIGEPIYAAAPGEVVYSGRGLRGYGNLVIVKHNKDYLTAYAHNKVLQVKEGDQVKAGQEIAKMGKSAAKIVALHFEIRYNGKPVDPLNFLPKKV